MWVALWWMKTWRLRTDRLIVGIYTSNWESGGCVYCRPVLGFFSFFLVPPPPAVSNDSLLHRNSL